MWSVRIRDDVILDVLSQSRKAFRERTMLHTEVRMKLLRRKVSATVQDNHELHHGPLALCGISDSRGIQNFIRPPWAGVPLDHG
jgi:hypothetical protein